MTTPAPDLPVSPKVAIVVVVYNMRREAPRTLYSLSAEYQRGVSSNDYDVIVVENGSSEPLTPESVKKFGSNFKYIYITDASPSPAAAINLGVARSTAPFVGIMIDGARMVSPGAINLALLALDRFDRAIVGTIAFHLGPDMQTRSPQQGYDQHVEDDLLTGIEWRTNGYRLFEISALAGSSKDGWIGRISESNLVFMSRVLFDELGGLDERFDFPGGGLVNLDFYRRACELKNTTLITLFGEATFHQIHGGVMTNRPELEVFKEIQSYRDQYQRIRGERFKGSTRGPLLMGFHRPEIVRGLRKMCDLVLQDQLKRLEPGQRASEASNRQKLASAALQQAGETPEMQPGADNYRAFVGHAKNYDVLGALQFSLLTSLGLRERHHLLDFGCGSLRAGRLFIPYLQAGRYWGIEPNEWLVQQGIERELGENIIKLKRPQFSHNDDFNLDVFDTSFDFVLAQSIFSHTGISQLRRCLQSARSVLRSDGLLVATFVEGREDRARDEWVYPGVNLFRWRTIADICTRLGLHCQKLDWPHILQTWFVASVDLQQMEQQVNSAGIDFLPDDVVITGWRVAKRDAGQRPGFYLRKAAEPSGTADKERKS